MHFGDETCLIFVHSSNIHVYESHAKGKWTVPAFLFCDTANCFLEKFEERSWTHRCKIVKQCFSSKACLQTRKERKAVATPNTWYQGLGHILWIYRWILYFSQQFGQFGRSFPKFCLGERRPSVESWLACFQVACVKVSELVPKVLFNPRPSSPNVPRKFMALWVLPSLINPYVRTYVCPYMHAYIHRWMHTCWHTYIHTTYIDTHTNKHSVYVLLCAYTHICDIIGPFSQGKFPSPPGRHAHPTGPKSTFWMSLPNWREVVAQLALCRWGHRDFLRLHLDNLSMDVFWEILRSYGHHYPCCRVILPNHQKKKAMNCWWPMYI